MIRQTANFSKVRWLGNPIWQSILDLWVIQETIAEVKPALLIETGTNRGGSSLFYAHLFDLMGKGEIITLDIEKLHDMSHPRITYLLGSSTAPEIVEKVRQRANAANGPVMVILDSDHSKQHVAKELECFSPMVTPGSYCLVQDGSQDTYSELRGDGPGPLPAIEEFLQKSKEFEVDEEKCGRYLVTHHPKGWLKRKKV